MEDSQQIWSSPIIIPVKQSYDSDTIVDFDVNTVFTGDTRTAKIKLGTLHDTCKQIAIPADSTLKQIMETACRDAGFNSVVQKAEDASVGLTRIRVRCVRNILHQPVSSFVHYLVLSFWGFLFIDGNRKLPYCCTLLLYLMSTACLLYRISVPLENAKPTRSELRIGLLFVQCTLLSMKGKAPQLHRTIFCLSSRRRIGENTCTIANSTGNN